jgi:intracellular septation protein A
MTETHDPAQQWQRNKHSLMVDIGLAALFFVTGSFSDHLALPAVVTACAGLCVVVAQRFVKVDLLGGLALFGVLTLLASAGLALAFQDDWAVKMRSTFLGAAIALLMAADGLFNRGGYFGVRMLRYMPEPLDPRRLTLGMAVLGLVSAFTNWAVASWLSKELWLYYTSFGDLVLTILLMVWVLRYARPDDMTETT